MSSRYVLVGSGVAALRAAEAIRAREGGARITLVSAEPHTFYSRPGLAYYLTREIAEARLALRTEREIRDLGLERITGSAVALAPEAHELRLGDGRSLHYDRLLLATGAGSQRLPHSWLRGVVRLDGLDDARAVAALAGPERVAVVIGGGSTALELVEGLAARGMRTHYLLRGDRYWPRVLDATESARVQAGLAAAGVQVHTREHSAVAVGDRQGRLRGVVTTSGDFIRCDVLAIAIGVRPRAGLARAAGLEVQRGILVDQQMRTSAPDILAAGDVAEVTYPDGRPGLETLWSSAAAQGEVAGENLSGGSASYVPPTPLNVTRLAGITTTIVGEIGGDPDADLQSLTRGQSERWRLHTGAASVRSAGNVRLTVRNGRLVGAVLMGDPETSRAAVELVRAQVPLPPDRLETWRQLGMPLPAALQQLQREWRGRAGAANGEAGHA